MACHPIEMCGLHVRPGIEADTPQVVALLNDTFRTPIDMATWQWYTQGNPLGPSRIYVAVEAGRESIGGVIAFAPMAFRLKGVLVPEPTPTTWRTSQSTGIRFPILRFAGMRWRRRPAAGSN